MNLLGETEGLLGFLFRSDDEIVVAEDAAKQLKDSAPQVLDAALAALEPLEDFTAAAIETALREAIVDGLGIKPRLAFGPVRTAVSLSLIHISEPTRRTERSRMPSSA